MKGWIFQANLDLYDVDTYLKEEPYIYWRVSRYKKEISVGDLAFIWRGGSKTARGIIGCGIVVEKPQPVETILHPAAIRSDLWKKLPPPSENTRLAGIQIVSFRLTPAEGMLSVDFLKQDAILSHLLIHTVHRHTNYYLKPEETQQVKKLWDSTQEIDDLTENNLSSPEGAIKYALHKRRERDHKLVTLAKELFVKKHGQLLCEICGFSFEETYKELGKGYIEAHHKKPIATMEEGDVTHVNDLMMLCANCHRMAHKENGMSFLTLHFKSPGTNENR